MAENKPQKNKPDTEQLGYAEKMGVTSLGVNMAKYKITLLE